MLSTFDERPQCRFADDRKHDVAHHAVGLRKRGVGKRKEEIRLTRHALEIVDERFTDAAVSFRIDAVNRVDEQVGERIGYRAAAQVREYCERRQACRLRMPA